MSSASLTDASNGLPAPGELVLGKYLVERYLAHGGMGVVAAGRHVELDEHVALKFLRPELLAGSVAQELSSRFVREARATTKIRSEHVPRMIDVATLPSGVPVMVMELLEGEDVDSWLERTGPMPVAFAVEVVLQAIEGLAAAHALGMVHRDFKPGNVFLSRTLDGRLRVKVLDFGIAKLADSALLPGSAGDMTSTNSSMGSPRYMAPEQMRSARDIDVRADVWAVGTTLYEMLTCAAPFSGDNIPQICASILQDAPRPVTRADVPRALVAVLERCLGKTPDLRPRDIAEVAEALAPFGPQPWSAESAARARRLVANAGGRASPSDPSLPLVTTTYASPVAPRASAETAGSWTGAAGVPSRKSRLSIVAVVCLGLAAVIGGGTFVYARGRRKASEPARATSAEVATTTPPPAPVPVPIAAPEPTAPEARPSASAPAPTSTVRVGTSGPMARPAEIKPAAARPVEPRPARTVEPAPPARKPTSGGLWDDRK